MLCINNIHGLQTLTFLICGDVSDGKGKWFEDVSTLRNTWQPIEFASIKGMCMK